MKYVYYILLSSSTLAGICQGTLRFTNHQSGERIEGVVVAIRPLSGSEELVFVTDAEGEIDWKEPAFPSVYRTSHLAFYPATDTLYRLPQEIRLQEKEVSLDEVVVTGQFEAQAIDKSVFTVRSIGRERMEAQGAVNLADILSNSLNVSITPDKGAGTTSVSMLGLSGQYVKVLVDGVPFVSTDGNGNNTDLTQINLNTIDRIEIVEGPMAVSYGANAVAGVINLITKKEPENSLSLQEETVGREYGPKEGRHIQNLTLGHRITDHLTVTGEYRRNDFQGFKNALAGADHLENNGLRGYDWHPKVQHAGSIGLSWDPNKSNLAYRLDLFDQSLERFSPQVFPDEHPATGLRNPYAFDQRTGTRRFVHRLHMDGQLGEIRYATVTSWSGVTTEERTFRHRLLTDVEEAVTHQDTSILRSGMSRGTFTDFIAESTIDFQVGYEVTTERIKDADIREGEKELINTAGFVNTEWTPMERLIIRPGIRLTYNSLYSSPAIWSLSARYLLTKGFDLRASYGRTYRTPDLTELYYYFVDANHDVRGNAGLLPEDGHGASLDLKKQFSSGAATFISSLKVFFNDLQNQITLGIVNESPLQYRYLNVDRFKSQGFTILTSFLAGDIEVNGGISVIGRYNQLQERVVASEDFLYSSEMNLNATYRFPKPGLALAAFYKHTGQIEQYILGGGDNFIKGKTAAYDWLDLTFTWESTDWLQISGGAKNLLDLTEVVTTMGQAGSHSGAPTSVGLSYGRSWFLRLTYNFGRHFHTLKN